MSFTVLSIVIISIFAAVACVEIYRGVKRGFIRSLISLGNIVVSLLLTFALTPIFSDMISQRLMKLVKNLAVYEEISQQLVSLHTVIPALLEMLIGSVLFVAVFFACRIVLSWLFALIYRWSTLRFSDDPGYGREDNSCSSRPTKIRGAICAGISAFLITMIVTAPLMGTLELADRALAVVGNADKKTLNSIGEENVQAVEGFSKDITGNLFYRMGGRWIYNNAASTGMRGSRVYLLSELETVEHMSGDMLKVYGIFQKPQEATQEHIAALEGLRENLKDLEVCEPLIADVIKQCSSAWKEGKSFLTVRRPAMNAMVEPAFLSILEVCSNTTLYSAEQNADTLLEIYSILLESGVFSMNTNDYGAILSALAENRTMERIDQALMKNPNMDEIDVSSIMMSAFSSYIANQNLGGKEYDDFATGIASAVNEINASSSGISQDRKVKEFSEHAQRYLSEAGMNIPQSVTEMLCSELLETLTGTDVSAEDVKFIFEKYKNG